MSKTKKPPGLLWPVYEFRPLPGFFRGAFRRYADGAWIEDDGEYDLAFIGMANSEAGWTYSCCLYFDPPYQKNIVCSWRGGPGNVGQVLHPDQNPWHYALRRNAKRWGGDWGRDAHPNRRAGSIGMSKMSSENGCSSGRHVEMRAGDPHIAAGLLRERDSKLVFTWPKSMTCMYCGEAPTLSSPKPAPGEDAG